jgi:hypothetical protein
MYLIFFNGLKSKLYLLCLRLQAISAAKPETSQVFKT